MICPTGKRDITLTKHHLRPKSKKGKPDEENILMICRDCHSHLHDTYDNNWLRDYLNTEEAIVSDEKMAKFGNWAGKQKSKVKRKMANNRKRR